MTYDLFIGDRAYSSWSLRGWLLFERFGLACTPRMIPFGDPRPVADRLPPGGGRTVPEVRTGDGTAIWDSLAIAEELATRHPDAGHWPADPAARATARSLTAEMHAGFRDLRLHCPMNLRTAYAGCAPTEAVLADLARLETIWARARAAHAGDSPWLCGPYSVADAFYAPIAARIAGYSLPVGPEAQAYVGAHLADPAFRRWRAMGQVDQPDLDRYARAYPQKPWPAFATRPAQAVDSGPSVNAACPYSGDPVTHFLTMDGTTYGFCNAFCRDKTAADPEAWPKFMAIVQ